LAAAPESSVDTQARSPASQTIAHYNILPCATASLRVSRIPATATPHRPLALFLPGILTEFKETCLRVLPLAELFDLVVCELPGHGITHEVADVSLQGFAQEYIALIDRYMKPSQRVFVVGESFGGLIGAALARSRPDRVIHLILIDTPVCLTRPPLAALLTSLWWRCSRSQYLGRIFRDVFGFDPRDGSLREAVYHYSMLADLQPDCTILAGCERFVLGNPPIEDRPPSQLTNADLTALHALERVTVLPRIGNAGHCILLDNPRACVEALSYHLAR
jgi:pimeloyl-ACP methyl ester carboxylesterase